MKAEDIDTLLEEFGGTQAREIQPIASVSRHGKGRRTSPSIQFTLVDGRVFWVTIRAAGFSGEKR